MPGTLGLMAAMQHMRSVSAQLAGAQWIPMHMAAMCISIYSHGCHVESLQGQHCLGNQTAMEDKKLDCRATVMQCMVHARCVGMCSTANSKCGCSLSHSQATRSDMQHKCNLQVSLQKRYACMCAHWSCHIGVVYVLLHPAKDNH